MHNVARDGGVHVLEAMCPTCVFRPGNLMHLRPGRLRGMISDAKRNESAIVCHSTLGTPCEAICRGYYDRHADDVWTLRLARGMGVIVEDPVPTKET